ncbi:MAG: hypothetical protein ACREVW_06690 [Burkholderiales bacterium]
MQFALNGADAGIGMAHDFVGVIASARIAEKQPEHTALGFRE